jgi:hypothetical protein
VVEREEDLKDFQVILSFDDYVKKITLKNPKSESFTPAGIKLVVKTSPENLCDKLKTAPIMYQVVQGDEDYGN